MTNEEALLAVRRMAAIWPQRALSDETILAYAERIVDLSADQAALAIERLAVTSTFLPSIAEIRQEAMASAPGGELPTPDEAWRGVLDAIAQVGWTRKLGNREPRWVHPLVGQVADRMGWEQLCLSENQMADRAHFMKLYEAASVRYQRDEAITPLGRMLSEAMQKRSMAILENE